MVQSQHIKDVSIYGEGLTVFEDKALLGYSYWSIFFATAAEDDDVRNLSLTHVKRALPGLGIFKDQSDEEIDLSHTLCFT